jgi:hypothetical protein
VNQYGAPVNQHGAPSSPAAADPFAAGAPAGGWGTPAPLPAQRSGYGRVVAGIAGVAVLVVAGLLVRWWFFPDLSKAIALPAAVGALSQGTSSGQGVTVQTKDREGHATAVAVYLDDATRPTQYAMIVAGRTGEPADGFDVPAGLQTTTVGKLTCTAETPAAELLAQTPQAGQSLNRVGLSTGAVCWRTGRTFTAVGFAMSSTGSARTTAMQAASAGWDAR